MARTIVGCFDSLDSAQRVADALRALGIQSGDISLVANDVRGRQSNPLSGVSSPAGAAAAAGTPDQSTAEAVGQGAAAGSAIGGVAGLSATLVGITVPGIGPLVAAGSIATALAGAGIGAVAGGLVGGLRHLGVPEPQAEAFADAVGRGAALVAVRIDDACADEVAALMHGHGARDPGAAPAPQAGLHG